MPEGCRADGVYEFGDFRLLAAQRRLTARADGRPIELTPKALDTLHFLVQHPGELLDKSTASFRFAPLRWIRMSRPLVCYTPLMGSRPPAASARPWSRRVMHTSLRRAWQLLR
jgi:hypothetical protein